MDTTGDRVLEPAVDATGDRVLEPAMDATGDRVSEPAVDATGDRAVDGGVPATVGVTGHRPDRLGLAAPERLDAVVDRVLEVLAASGHRVLVSGLAEGADRRVARRALAFGWVLQALLPFEPERYERDFATEGSRLAFRELLALAAAVETVHVPDAPYRAQGRRLIERSAVLIAVWDGAPARGPGGTAEVVEQARAAARPVVWVHAVAPHGVRVLAGLEPADGVESSAIQRGAASRAAALEEALIEEALVDEALIEERLIEEALIEDGLIGDEQP